MRHMLSIVIVLLLSVSVAGLAIADAGEGEDVQMEEVDLDEEAAELEDADLEEDDSEVTLDLVINAIPAALLIDMSGNNFGVGPSGQSVSSVYMMPNVNAGVGVNINDAVYLDATVGAGVLVNNTFRAFLVQAAVSGTIAVTDSLNLGPRVGLINFFDGQWLEDQTLGDEVEFDDTTGLLVGIQMALGDRIRYLVSVDYIAAEFDVAPTTVPVTGSSLELEGLAVQFGVRGEF